MTARVVKLKLWWLILLIRGNNIVSVEYIDILMVMLIVLLLIWKTMIQQFDRRMFWIIAGDANINLIRIEYKEVQNDLTTLMSYKLMPIITLPTRITSHSQTCIDLTFVKCDANTYITSCVSYNDISDHLRTTVILQDHSKVTIIKRPLCRKKFIETFRNTDWEQLFASEDDLYSKFIE